MTTESKEIIKAITVTAEIAGRSISAEAVTLMAKELEVYPHEEVMEALHKCARECRNRLSLADILDRLPNQPLGADAAWELAVRSRVWDEEVTVVIPTAVLTSFPRSLWKAGDKVGARMAFKSRYPEHLAACGDEVFVSLGWDPEGRRAAIEEAARNGIITEAKARVLLGPAEPPKQKQIATGRPASVADIAAGMDLGGKLAQPE